MKRLATIALLSAGLAAGPVFAGKQDRDTRPTISLSTGADVVAHNYRGHGRSHRHGRSYRDDHRWDRGHRYESRLHPIHKTFVAKRPSNVRAGPSTYFAVTDTLYRHERVRVIGRVKGRNWYMVRINGRRGFVYAPLLRPDHHGYRGYSRHDHDRRGYSRYDHDRRSESSHYRRNYR